MAVQTIILRPNGQRSTTNSNNFSRVPADTTDDNLYMLLNEEVADDDATYVYTSSPVAQLQPTFPFEQIADIVPIDIRLVVRMKSSGILWYPRLNTQGYNDSEGNSVSNYTNLKYNENLDTYETLRGTISDFELIKNQLSTLKFLLFFSYSDDNDDKTGSVSITQLYLEVDYDDGQIEVAEFHHKKSGVWESISGAVYEKINGVWATSNLDGLSAGDCITVKEL